MIMLDNNVTRKGQFGKVDFLSLHIKVKEGIKNDNTKK